MEQGSQKIKAEETEFQSSNAPILCINNCGFFGNPATNNLCSKCYKDHFLSKSKVFIDTLEAKEVDESVKAGTFGASPSEEPPASKKPRNRCSFCNKKVGLMGFNCRCGELYCSTHRYSDKHNCAFDYRGSGQDAIAKANPIVKKDKIEKI